MAGKISFLVGLGAGYVLGARSGRERYDQIATKAQGLWRDPRVQEKVAQTGQLAKDKAGEASSKLTDKVSETVGSGSNTTGQHSSVG
jgi:hypothetical protein